VKKISIKKLSKRDLIHILKGLLIENTKIIKLINDVYDMAYVIFLHNVYDDGRLYYRA
jgi:hypothetical protein